MTVTVIAFVSATVSAVPAVHFPHSSEPLELPLIATWLPPDAGGWPRILRTPKLHVSLPVSPNSPDPDQNPNRNQQTVSKESKSQHKQHREEMLLLGENTTSVQTVAMDLWLLPISFYVLQWSWSDSRLLCDEPGTGRRIVCRRTMGHRQPTKTRTITTMNTTSKFSFGLRTCLLSFNPRSNTTTINYFGEI